jgi:hypothetical protein
VLLSVHAGGAELNDSVDIGLYQPRGHAEHTSGFSTFEFDNRHIEPVECNGQHHFVRQARQIPDGLRRVP